MSHAIPVIVRPRCVGLTVCTQPHEMATDQTLDSHLQVAPTSEMLQGVIQSVCSIGTTLSCPIAVATLQAVVIQLRAIHTALHSEVQQETREVSRGKPYRGSTILQALLLAGLHRDNGRLKEVVKSSMKLSYKNQQVAADLMQRVDDLPLPSASTLSRWAFVLDVAFMARPLAPHPSDAESQRDEVHEFIQTFTTFFAILEQKNGQSKARRATSLKPCPTSVSDWQPA